MKCHCGLTTYLVMRSLKQRLEVRVCGDRHWRSLRSPDAQTTDPETTDDPTSSRWAGLIEHRDAAIRAEEAIAFGEYVVRKSGDLARDVSALYDDWKRRPCG